LPFPDNPPKVKNNFNFERASMKLSDYSDQATVISKHYELRIDLGSILSRVSATLPTEHAEELIRDTGHGFEHGIQVAEYGLKIAPEDSGRESIALAALFHDICGVKFSGFTRENHAETGAETVNSILPGILSETESSYTDIEAVSGAVRFHTEDVIYFRSILDSKLTPKRYTVAAAVRDADTLDESLNVERIIRISEHFEQPIIRSDIPRMRRIAILFCENPTVVDSKQNDLLMFLLRNVTKGVDPDHYLLPTTKALLDDDILKKNMAAIRSGLFDYRYPGDFTDFTSLEKEMNEIIDLFSDFKKAGVENEAKSIIRKFADNGANYFFENDTLISAKLHAILHEN
jgi:hypothetical protein